MGGYIILNDQKQATHKFKDGIGAKSWDEVKDYDNVAMIVPYPFIVLDFDTVSDSQIMLKIVESLDLKCKVMKTTRGYHFWFKSEEPWKCFKKTRLAVGIYSDCKSHSKNAYVVIKKDGQMREWVRQCKADEIEPVPEWLRPISQPNKQFLFKGMKEGDGRNQELFNYIVYLQSKGMSRDGIKDAIHIINNYVFEQPLPEHEINTILRDEAFKSDEEIEQQRAERLEKFSHNTFGDELINEFNIITVNNQLYIYEDGYYQQDERIIENKMIEIFPTILQRQRSEVLAYIRIKTHVNQSDIKVNPYIINLENTRLDLRTEKLLSFTPDAIEFDRIPVKYDPSAYCVDLDKMLNRVFLCDREVMDLFEEMLGYCLIKHCDYQKGFMLYGSGSNGKSTILDLIKRFIGSRNYTSIELDKVTGKFETAELEHKLANIGDDVNNKSMGDTGLLKKLFSGNSVLVQRKGERPFDLEPYAKHIYSCNEIPRSANDKTVGFYRRWIFVPFNAVFKTTDADYDPLIKEKIFTDEALSYLLNLAIKGAKRLMINKSFTEPAIVKATMEEYKIDNSSVLTWVDEIELTLIDVCSKPRDELYTDFVNWCRLSNVKQITGKKTFFKEMKEKFELADTVRQDKATGKRYFQASLD
jgi:putative DNA primase/helicase